MIQSASANDPSLWSFAEAAAKRSRFSASTTAPDPQIGSILYRFIIAIALRMHLPAEALKLISAVIVALAIAVPYLKARAERRKPC